MRAMATRICRGLWAFLALLGVHAGAATSTWPSVEGSVLIQYPIEVKADWEGVKPPGERLRVASYDIQDFADAVRDGPNRTIERLNRQASLAAVLIGEIDPDILVMQEIENGRALAVLNAALPNPYPLAYITRFSEGGNRELNVAVLSRVALSGVRELDFGRLSGPGRPPRGVLTFVANLDDRHKLLVYGVHLKANYGENDRNIAKRFHAIKLVAEDAARVKSRYPGYEWEMIVMGDMNVDPDVEQFARDPSLDPLKEWKDLWRGRPIEERATIPTRYGDPAFEFPPAAFDRIFASPELIKDPWKVGTPSVLQRGVDTQNVLVVGGENDVHVSDHFPVYVDLTR